MRPQFAALVPVAVSGGRNVDLHVQELPLEDVLLPLLLYVFAGYGQLVAHWITRLLLGFPIRPKLHILLRLYDA